MNKLLTLICLLFSILSYGQYPFEKYPVIKYKEYKNWKFFDKSTNEKKFQCAISIPKFFDHKDSLTVELTSFTGKRDSSYITLFRNQKEVQKLLEPMFFDGINVFAPIMIADINGDHLKDLKLIVPYMGNGIASMNTRVIYLFQRTNKKFAKISYIDKMGEDEVGENRPERNFNNDGNYEIITQTLSSYQNHSYWVFNIYNFKKDSLINVSLKYNYPILVQLLYRKNYKITDKLTTQKMKEFMYRKPDDYDLR